MNKQQLANKIWESANKMRSKIEANEYKDYILGFIFYKFLSDTEIKYLKSNGCTDDDLVQITEENAEMVEFIRQNVGYFIAYENLFSTWLAMGSDFNVANVRDALSAFSRLINPTHKKVFDKIFDTLQTGLSKLGDSSGSQTKAISDLLHLIKDIPMDGKQDYDVLGFIYEYLISNFAANAGKKAGEFYTPHEVSLLMSEIVANHLKERSKIDIYDPTSGSGSLLINIGKSVAKYLGSSEKIKFHAQELKENTYNLTRMNLVMRGISPDNIVTRNGDTLEEDWPYFDENDPVGTYNPLYVDAVVSNPPYSQNWNPLDKETDPRYKRYGVAPKGKADYAFLLHDLYHIKPDGIMTIVLPHGVLFRGGEEGTIRKNLIENNNIDAVIGLPANIFFGTGIPTIVMVLKQKRLQTDVLIVDASKGFEKVGKNNKLRSSDIKRIVDVVTHRESVPKFSKVVSRDEIRQNDYNLNIPRYVDSSEKSESWDIYASMFGGIPAGEVEELAEYWAAFPNLKVALFANPQEAYLQLLPVDLKQTATQHSDVKAFQDQFNAAFDSFAETLNRELIGNMQNINIANEESLLAAQVFERLQDVPLIDKYHAYQLLDDEWSKIAADLEVIQTEGFAAVKAVDPNMVVKKKDNKDTEAQDGWVGHVMPFALVQAHLLKDESRQLSEKETRLSEIAGELTELIESFSEEEMSGCEESILNDDATAFVAKNLAVTLKQALANVATPETTRFEEYCAIANKADKLSFIAAHQELNWQALPAGKNGIYTNKAVEEYVGQLKAAISFDEDSFEYKMIKANALLAEEKTLKEQIKRDSVALQAQTKVTIESLTDEQACMLLQKKWIDTLIDNLRKLPAALIDNFVSKIQALKTKYDTTLQEVEEQINETELSLSAMLDELTGSEYDQKGLAEFQKLLRGEH